MKTDSIVQEVRDARASIAADFDYDLSKYLVWIREQTRLRKEAIASKVLSKPPQTTEQAAKSPVMRKRRVRASGASV